jgi:hypothetical protein
MHTFFKKYSIILSLALIIASTPIAANIQSQAIETQKAIKHSFNYSNSTNTVLIAGTLCIGIVGFLYLFNKWYKNQQQHQSLNNQVSQLQKTPVQTVSTTTTTQETPKIGNKKPQTLGQAYPDKVTNPELVMRTGLYEEQDQKLQALKRQEEKEQQIREQQHKEQEAQQKKEQQEKQLYQQKLLALQNEQTTCLNQFDKLIETYQKKLENENTDYKQELQNQQNTLEKKLKNTENTKNEQCKKDCELISQNSKQNLEIQLHDIEEIEKQIPPLETLSEKCVKEDEANEPIEYTGTNQYLKQDYIKHLETYRTKHADLFYHNGYANKLHQLYYEKKYAEKIINDFYHKQEDAIQKKFNKQYDEQVNKINKEHQQDLDLLEILTKAKNNELTEIIQLLEKQQQEIKNIIQKQQNLIPQNLQSTQQYLETLHQLQTKTESKINNIHQQHTENQEQLKTQYKHNLEEAQKKLEENQKRLAKEKLETEHRIKEQQENEKLEQLKREQEEQQKKHAKEEQRIQELPTQLHIVQSNFSKLYVNTLQEPIKLNHEANSCLKAANFQCILSMPWLTQLLSVLSINSLSLDTPSSNAVLPNEFKPYQAVKTAKEIVSTQNDYAFKKLYKDYATNDITSVHHHAYTIEIIKTINTLFPHNPLAYYCETTLDEDLKKIANENVYIPNEWFTKQLDQQYQYQSELPYYIACNFSAQQICPHYSDLRFPSNITFHNKIYTLHAFLVQKGEHNITCRRYNNTWYYCDDFGNDIELENHNSFINKYYTSLNRPFTAYHTTIIEEKKNAIFSALHEPWHTDPTYDNPSVPLVIYECEETPSLSKSTSTTN